MNRIDFAPLRRGIIFVAVATAIIFTLAAGTGARLSSSLVAGLDASSYNADFQQHTASINPQNAGIHITTR